MLSISAGPDEHSATEFDLVNQNIRVANTGLHSLPNEQRVSNSQQQHRQLAASRCRNYCKTKVINSHRGYRCYKHWAEPLNLSYTFSIVISFPRVKTPSAAVPFNYCAQKCSWIMDVSCNEIVTLKKIKTHALF